MLKYTALDYVSTDVPSVTIGPYRDTVFNDAAVSEYGLSKYHSVSISLSFKGNVLCFKFADFWDDYMDSCGYAKLFKSTRFANTSYCFGHSLWVTTLYPYLYPNIDSGDWGSTRMELGSLGLIDGDYRLYCKIDRYARR